MLNKIKVNIREFGEIYYSNNVEFKINNMFYIFRKKGTKIYHNEYGLAYANKNGSYGYFINDELHKLNNFAYYNKNYNNKEYYVIGKFVGKTKEEFIKNLANTLITKNKI